MCYFISFYQFSRTALHWAARAGHDKVVALLLAAGADVNIADHVRFIVALLFSDC